MEAETAIGRYNKGEEMNALQLRREWKINLKAVVKENWPAVGFFLRFVLFLGGIYFLLNGIDERFSPIGFVNLIGINKAVALISGWLLNLFGAGTKTIGNLILSKTFTFYIDDSCTAVDASSYYLSAVLAYPGRLKEKAWGILLGLLALQVLNILRVVALFYIMLWFPGYFSGVHVYAAQVLFIGYTGALWLWWTECFQGPAEP